MAENENSNNDTPVNKKRWVTRIIMYVATLALFLAYIFFASDSNLKKHKRLEAKAKQYEQVNASQKALLDKAREYENIQVDTFMMEKYRREVLNLKKADEDLFIVE